MCEKQKILYVSFSGLKKDAERKTVIILFGASMGAATVMNALNYTEEVKRGVE